MKAHKHAHALIAIANGQELQYAGGGDDGWQDWPKPIHKETNFSPLHCHDSIEWRVKPSTIRIGERDVPVPMTTAPVIDRTELKAAFDSFLETLNDTSKDEWYPTDRVIHETVLKRFEVFLYGDDDAKAERRRQYEELKKEFEGETK